MKSIEIWLSNGKVETLSQVSEELIEECKDALNGKEGTPIMISGATRDVYLRREAIVALVFKHRAQTLQSVG